MLFAVGFKSLFLFPHTEEKADKIPSWVETALQSSKTTFPRTFRKLVENFVQLTIIGNQFRGFKRCSGKAGCGWLLRLRKRTNPSCISFFSLVKPAFLPGSFCGAVCGFCLYGTISICSRILGSSLMVNEATTYAEHHTLPLAVCWWKKLLTTNPPRSLPSKQTS